jgi:citrate lyase subunit beta / citryl-CoA lyase
MYRSLLYVPASSERFIAKAAERGADAIILDLEDSVAVSEKDNARAKLAQSVERCRTSGADVFVRINRPLRMAVRDIEAAASSAATGLLLSKVEGPEHARLLLELAGECERDAGRSEPLKAMALLESPGAIFKAEAIARADERIIGLMGGGEDLALSLGALPSAETLRIPKMMIHMAAMAAGRFSFGLFGTVADFADTSLIRAMAAEARRFGLTGATCVHPSVVPVLNEAFSPSAEEIGNAKAIIAAAEQHAAKGVGAFTLDGKMIDEPVVERARRLLKRMTEGRRRRTEGKSSD